MCQGLVRVRLKPPNMPETLLKTHRLPVCVRASSLRLRSSCPGGPLIVVRGGWDSCKPQHSGRTAELSGRRSELRKKGAARRRPRNQCRVTRQRQLQPRGVRRRRLPGQCRAPASDRLRWQRTHRPPNHAGAEDTSREKHGDRQPSADRERHRQPGTRAAARNPRRLHRRATRDR